MTNLVYWMFTSSTWTASATYFIVWRQWPLRNGCGKICGNKYTAYSSFTDCVRWSSHV